jgi:RNA polymerase sigma factor (sigma-70 family)
MNVHPTDEELLTSRDPEAFGVFYARHLAGVERYFARRVGDHETAADLAAETFAAALVARRRFVPGDVPAAGWLYTIASRRHVDHQRRAAVELRARETLESEAQLRPAAPAPEPADPAEPALLRGLPEEQRRAIAAHVLREQSYGQIAAVTRSSEASIRQRVSRGLRTLRAPLLIYRAAQSLMREDRAYEFGGGHRTFLAAVGPRDPLDCSGATSLLLRHAGALDSDTAWVSGRFAEDWGVAGEGEHVTLWASPEHVWLEFRLDGDHAERFDPTPSRLSPDRGWLARQDGPKRECVPRHLPGL